MPQSGLRPPDFTEHAAPASKDKAAGRLEADEGATATYAKRRDAADRQRLTLARRKTSPRHPSHNVRQPRLTRYRGFAQSPPPPVPRAAEAPAQKPAPEIGNVMGKVLDRDRSEEKPVSVRNRAMTAKQSADAAPTEAKPAPTPAAKPPLSPSPEARSAPHIVVAGSADGATANGAARTQAATRPEAKPGFASPPPSVQPMAKPELRENAPAATAESLSKLERSAELAPDKWLERIEELRKQGKLEEAKASLAEFRKRYPDYRLPDALRNGIRE